MTDACGRTRARWLVLALIAGGCDEGSDPVKDESMDGPPGDGGEAGAPFDGDGAADGDDGGDDPPADDVGPTPTFAADVLPILQASCSCHGAGAEAGVDLSDEAAYDTLVFGEASIGAPFVVPEEPGASYLVLKLRGDQATVGGSGSRMPLGTPLGDDTIAVVERWIIGGAPE